jgi:hypothetical protein
MPRLDRNYRMVIFLRPVLRKWESCSSSPDQKFGQAFRPLRSCTFTWTLTYHMWKISDGPVLRLELEIGPVSPSPGATPLRNFTERVVPRHKAAVWKADVPIVDSSSVFSVLGSCRSLFVVYLGVRLCGGLTRFVLLPSILGRGGRPEPPLESYRYSPPLAHLTWASRQTSIPESSTTLRLQP